MEIVFKAAACALISVVLSIILSRHNKELSLLITVAACCLIAIVMLSYLQPVLDFFRQLGVVGNIGQDTLNILFRSTGIALLTEITSTICADAGNSTLGKILQMLAAVVILWLSLPLLTQMMDLLDGILGSV